MMDHSWDDCTVQTVVHISTSHLVLAVEKLQESMHVIIFQCNN